ncbi:CG8668 [Drosophila busckii]|uniref:CG8668 n=1 Tax=Drosophila busckii TaxID=30019 RepID=A0A0M4EBD2_DROBS|nr:beta-1,3-galactosyltransferase 2 isoform X1 [Drosophila busckii]ALC38722.1 CG8668 [Drosophila busckii]
MVAVGNVHNTRILRFLLVLIVVVLTIFIYTSYSTTTTLTTTHMHTVPMPPTPLPLNARQQQSQSAEQPAVVVLNSTGEFGLVQSQDELAKVKDKLEHKKAASHRLPTIDEDALLDGGAAGASAMTGSEQQAQNMADELLEEQQYVQNVEAITGNINNNINNNNNASAAAAAPPSPQQQQQSDADSLMIPTSNLQKFIENADKILKNITSNSSNTQPAAAAAAAAAGVASPNDQRTDKNNQPSGPEETLDVEAPSNAVMQVKQQEAKVEAPAPPPIVPHVPIAKSRPKPKPLPARSTAPVDPSKGIPAEHIYESGHLIDEIDVERICPLQGINILLLVLITSAQSHAEARMSIRQTWGHYGTRRDIGMAFVLGRGTNETLNQALTDENYMYGDLIRGNFIDSYNNLTLKTMSSLEWADQYCQRAKYILKTDDDMFINVPKLLKFLKQLESHSHKRVIYGRLAKKWKPVRNKKSKYYVSVDQFPPAVFPSFTTGPAYVMTGDIVHELYAASLKTVYLKLEDVFTTGIVAQNLGIERLHVNEFVNRRISFNPCNIRNAISVHMIKSNEQFDLWKKLLDQTTKCK